MMKAARYVSIAVLSACICSLTGCSTLDHIIGADDWKDWTPDSNCIQVHGDGSLTETIFDKLDQSWYTGNELQDMIARSMNEYNAAHASNSINVTSYSDTNGDIQVSIKYLTGEDYAEYNNAVFCSGSMLDAEMQGFLFSGPFCAVDGAKISSQTVDASEPLSHKEYSVVISDGTHVVQVPGEIKYVTSNAYVENSHVARLADGNESAQTEMVVSADVDPRTEGPSEKEIDQSCLYIIYEKDEELYPADSEEAT